MKNSKAIGVFDSGIGGLSVLKQFVRYLPYEKYIYLGDTARVPYGNRSPETVIEYTTECVKFLLEKDVKLIIIACNTASALALDIIRNISDVPVIGMIIPAVTAALRASVNNRIGVIGTRATINSNSYSDVINKMANPTKIQVFSRACPLFVPFAEEGLLEHPATKLLAEEYLSPFRNENIDTLVLGCTHYPLLSRMISELLPNVNLIDSGEHAAVSAIRQLAELSQLVDERDEYIIKPNIDFYVSDMPAMFYDVAKLFLGFPVESLKRVNIGKN